MTLDKRLTWSTHIDQMRNKEAQRLGVLANLLNRKSGVSIRKAFYCIRISSVLWWTTRPSPGSPPLAPMSGNCRSFNSSVATNAPWYIGNRQIHEDFEVPFFADHMIYITERFDWNSADVWHPLVRQLGRYLRWSCVKLRLLKRPKKNDVDKLIMATWQKVAMSTYEGVLISP